MAHIILTGATGNAGAAILSYCLASSTISKVSILSRRPVKMADGNSKANVIIHTDYKDYSPELLQQLHGATGCVWAQGKSAIGMSESDYLEITHDYPLAAARAFSTLGDRMNFVYVSGEGADMKEKSHQMFGRIKGRAEAALLALATTTPSLKVYNVRPAMIDPRGNFLGDRERTFAEKAAHSLAPVFRALTPSLVSPTDKLAEVLVNLAVGDGEPIPAGKGVEADGRLLRNTALRRLGGL